MELQHSHSCSRLNSVWMRGEQGQYVWKKWCCGNEWNSDDHGSEKTQGFGDFFFGLVGWGVLGFFCVGYVYFFSCARCIGGSREDKCTARLPALWKLFLALWQNRPDDLLSTLIHEKLLHLLTSDAFIVNNGLFCTAKAGKGKPIAIPNEFHCCNSKIAHFETL